MPIKVNCKQCDKPLLLKPSKVKRQKYCFCSIKCKAEFQKTLEPWNKGVKGVLKSHRKNISMIEEYGEEKASEIKAHISKVNTGRKATKEEVEKSKQTRIKNKTLRLYGKRNGMYGRNGKLNPNWQGGVSYWRKKYYQEPVYKKWHAAVLKRDNYRCQICKQTKTEKGILHVHHIKPFSKYPKLRTTLSNGITLCKYCHNAVHSKKYQLGKVVSVEKTTNIIPMRDIEVEDNHNFFANDVLVHNSATPERDDCKSPILHGLIGDIIYHISSKELIDQGYLVKPQITFFQDIQEFDTFEDYTDEYQQTIVENDWRNKKIVDIVDSTKKTLILTRYVQHGAELSRALKCNHLHGSLPKAERKNMFKQFKENENCIVMTQSIGAEGLDIPDLDVIINAAANAGNVKSIQVLGRVLRTSEGKDQAVYYDFYDSSKAKKRHSRMRVKAFREQGYAVKIV